MCNANVLHPPPTNSVCKCLFCCVPLPVQVHPPQWQGMMRASKCTMCAPEKGSLRTFMAAGSSERSWKPAMLRSEKIWATSCSENLRARHKLLRLLPYLCGA